MTQSYKLWDFPGGIHPAEHKLDSNQTDIRRLPLPTQVILPLGQHKGAAAEPVVKVGDRVAAGQLIAEAQGLISAHVHASIGGVVSAIEDRPIAHALGLSDTCIVIDADSEPDSGNHIQTMPPLDWQQATVHLLADRFREAGLAGLGGAAFPTDVKYRSSHPIHTLILNGAECEPYITADDRLMREYATEILIGGQIMAQALEAKIILIGIEDNKPEAIKAIETAIHHLQDDRLQLRVVPTKYPSGGSNQLIQILTGREVPSHAHASELGMVCQNVGTAYAVQQAVEKGMPLIERVVTLTGNASQTKGNYWVRLGTPFQALIEEAKADAEQIIMGGPLMGFTVHSADVPVVKATNCILIPGADEFNPAGQAAPCIRCGLCEQVCPANLLPQQLYWNAKNHEWGRAQLNSLDDCIECGACAWICPSQIPLVQYYRYAKAEIIKEEQEQLKSDRARERFEFRQARLEKEAREKEVRRKARAEAAAKAQQAKQSQGDQASSLSAEQKSKIAEAVARSQARKQSSATAQTDQPVSIEDLTAKLETAREKVNKAQQRLEEATANNPEQVQALTLAVSKLKEKAALAEQAVETAQKNQSTDTIVSDK